MFSPIRPTLPSTITWKIMFPGAGPHNQLQSPPDHWHTIQQIWVGIFLIIAQWVTLCVARRDSGWGTLLELLAPLCFLTHSDRPVFSTSSASMPSVDESPPEPIVPPSNQEAIWWLHGMQFFLQPVCLEVRSHTGTKIVSFVGAGPEMANSTLSCCKKCCVWQWHQSVVCPSVCPSVWKVHTHPFPSTHPQPGGEALPG